MTSAWRDWMRAGALSALLATPAAAQIPNVNLIPETRSRTPEEIERDKQLDRAYRESLRKIPDAQKSNDPWGDVRGAAASAPKPEARPKPGPPKRAKADVKPDAPAN